MTVAQNNSGLDEMKQKQAIHKLCKINKASDLLKSEFYQMLWSGHLF